MDLNAPLGMTPAPRPRRRVAPLALVGFAGILGAIVLGAIALGAIVAVLGDPRGGRPFAVATIPPPIAPPRPATLDTAPTGTVSPSALPALPQVHPGEPPDLGGAVADRNKAGRGAGSLESGVMVYRGSAANGTTAPQGPVIIDVTRVLDDPLGKARGDKLPVSGTAKPARSADRPAAAQRPRVAIFVSGMGLDAGATRTASETMPPAITLAFLPYGGSLAASVDAAKARGHEVLLQLPMRNDGGAAGPHSLRADAPAEATNADLAWLMDRFSGYDGVVNLLGAPVTADASTMSTVLKAVAARHLFYLDDGTSRRSVATRLARENNVDASAADLVLDATSDPSAIQANLDRLVTLAKSRGHAIGMATGVPEHLGTIARFAADLDGKGVMLVPVATLVRGGGTPLLGAAAAP